MYTFYDHYNKDKLDTVENLVLRTKNKTKYEKRLLKMLVDKYGPEPDQNSFKSRLIRYYSKYQPSKLSSVDNLVKKAGDSIQQQEQLFRMLVSKYGPEPDLEDAVTSAMENLAIDNEGMLFKFTFIFKLNSSYIKSYIFMNISVNHLELSFGFLFC